MTERPLGIYFHPMSYGRRAVWPIDQPAPTIRGVQRVMPSGYAPHPGDVTDDPRLVYSGLTVEEAAILQSYPPFAAPVPKGNPMKHLVALDDFAGTGWGVACQRLGIEEYGVELMPEAVATREANGMRTVGRDVWAHIQTQLANPLQYNLLIASPPCQTFSMAGKGSGRQALDEVLGLIDSMAYLDVEKLHAFGDAHDPRTALVLAPLVRIVHDLPTYIVLEQVPPVLPVWKRYAEELEKWGYSTWAGVLNAEQYGVPQTRKRAVLIARADDIVAAPPAPTHSRYYPTDPAKLDPGVLPWVSMAEALGWGMTDEPMPTITAGTHGPPDRWASGGQSVRKRINAKVDGPAWQSAPIPSPTVTGGGGATGGAEPFGTRARSAILKSVWENRPATTVAADDRIAGPGWSGPGEGQHPGSRQDRPGTMRVEVPEAAALQSYPADFDWSPIVNGKPLTKTKAMLQIGNAVPPLLAQAVLSVFLDERPTIDGVI